MTNSQKINSQKISSKQGKGNVLRSTEHFDGDEQIPDTAQTRSPSFKLA
jgi:hypothetical protein